MPVYNSAEFLPETLEHIFSQSFIDFELLAINDGSNDNSLDILHDYAKRDERLSIETIEKATLRPAIPFNTGKFLQAKINPR